MNSIDMKAQAIVSTHVKINITKIKDVVFLKLLQKGSKVSFYSYSDKIKTRYFINKNETSTFQELEFVGYSDSTNKKKFY